VTFDIIGLFIYLFVHLFSYLFIYFAQLYVFVSDICLEPLDIGWCNFFYPKPFYFNSETGQCAELSSGCSASDNAFDSLEACEQQCAKHFASSVTTTAATVSGK